MADRTCPKCGTMVRVAEAPIAGLCPRCLYQSIVADDLPEPLEGSELGNYHVLGLLGSGGMGTVYRARQKGLERTVALKVLSGSGKEEVERFFREARSAASLRHPNIVSVHEVSSARGYYFLTMDLIDGGTLGDALRAGLPPKRVAEIARIVCRAVHYAHEHGIVHRDLKPANILLDPNGQPLVTDFGLARELSSGGTLTMSGMVMGTPAYMPPEQAIGSRAVDARSDVYSLGAILYECLTGIPPYAGDSPFDVLRKSVSELAVPPRRIRPGIDRDLETICLKAMEKEKPRRYASAAAMADDLDRYLAGESIRAERPGPIRRARVWTRHHPAIALGIVVAAICLAAFIPVIVASHRRMEAERQARVHLDRARERIRMGMPESAGPEIERALALVPHSAEAVYLRGLAAEKQGRTAVALDDYRRATRLDPELSDAWHRLFWLLISIEFGRFELQMGCASNPEVEAAWKRLGTLTLKPEQIETARAFWRMRETFREGVWVETEGIGFKPDEPRLRALEEEMLAALGRALEHDPLDVDAFLLRANVRQIMVALGCQDDLAAGLRDADRALEIEPRNRDVLLTRGEILCRLGRRDEALRAAERIVEIAPDVGESHLYRAVLLSLLGDRDGALAAFADAEARGGDPCTVPLMRIMHRQGILTLPPGQITKDRKELDLASGELATLLEKFPDHVPALILRFFHRMYALDLPGAMQDLKRIESLDPGNPMVRTVRKRIR